MLRRRRDAFRAVSPYRGRDFARDCSRATCVGARENVRAWTGRHIGDRREVHVDTERAQVPRRVACYPAYPRRRALGGLTFPRCGKRDASNDATLLVNGDEGATAPGVL